MRKRRNNAKYANRKADLKIAKDLKKISDDIDK
jgi:hypothetical protein